MHSGQSAGGVASHNTRAQWRGWHTPTHPPCSPQTLCEYVSPGKRETNALLGLHLCFHVDVGYKGTSVPP